VVVTAQRRSENLQDVPITVQAISGAQLAELNVVSFNDLMKYTPNITFSGNGPGTGNIFMRGWDSSVPATSRSRPRRRSRMWRCIWMTSRCSSQRAITTST